MKLALTLTTTALLALAGCATADSEPPPEPTSSAPPPTSGAAINHEAETTFEEQRNAWLTECHDLLDADRATTHDISWDNMVNLDSNEYRLIGTASHPASDTEFPIVCDVNSNWDVSLDTIRSALPRDSGAMMKVRYASDFNHDWPLKADDVKLGKCLDILADEYGTESVSVVVDFSSVNRTGQGEGHVIDGTSTGSVTSIEPMEFACSVPDDGETELIWFTTAR